MTDLSPSQTGAGARALEFLALVNWARRDALLDDLEQRMETGKGFSVATLNLDHITKLMHDAVFRRAYAAHSHVVADGNPIVSLLKRMGRAVDLIPGSELIAPLAARAARTETPVALYGASQESLDAAAARLEAAHDGLEVVCKIAPPFGFDPDGPEAAADLKRIARSGAGLCFVALGAPKQERFAARGAGQVPACGFVSIGAGLDFIAGTQKRAPVWVRRAKLEWFWRMATNPRRLFLRYWRCGIIYLRMKYALRSGARPEGFAHDG